MNKFLVIFRQDIQCVAPCDVVDQLKSTIFPNGIGKPLIIIDQCKKDCDGLTVTLKYRIESDCSENAVSEICDIMDFDALGDETVFSVLDLGSGQKVDAIVFQDGTVKIAA